MEELQVADEEVSCFKKRGERKRKQQRLEVLRRSKAVGKQGKVGGEGKELRKVQRLKELINERWLLIVSDSSECSHRHDYRWHTHIHAHAQQCKWSEYSSGRTLCCRSSVIQRSEELLAWSGCENAVCSLQRLKRWDLYLAWGAGGFSLPRAREAGEPVAGCAASALPAWCPCAPVFCQSVSSEPVLNKRHTHMNTHIHLTSRDSHGLWSNQCFIDLQRNLN